MLLENKNAVIYGAAGAVGGAVARNFARNGAHVFLAGRSLAPLNALAVEISAAGGRATPTQVDALDRQAVADYVSAVVSQAGSLDISFNAISLGDSQGMLFVDMSLENFNLPIATAMQTQFLTTTAAARQMILQKSGVILAITANASRMAFTHVGGFGVACAAIEGYFRQLAAELGPHGIRVNCLRSAGSPDSPGVKEVFELHAKNAGVTFDEFLTTAAKGTLLGRLPMLAEVANAAAFMASDLSSSMTASVANLTCGLIAD